MAFLLDTNILLRTVEPKHPMHDDAVAAVSILLANDELVYVLAQNIVEFWNVCTRPADKNGLGFSIKQTNAEVTQIENLLTVIPDIPEVYTQWRRLVVQYSVSGIQVHDARIAAAMKAHAIKYIVTFNGVDFRRYKDIDVLTPSEIITKYADET